MKTKILAILVFGMLLFTAVGCDELPFIGNAMKVTSSNGGNDEGQNKDTKYDNKNSINKELFVGNGTIDSSPGVDSRDDSESDSDDNRYDNYQKEYGQLEKPRTYCGDGECNGRENCDTCKDCACGTSELCHEGKCRTPKCITDEDCVDNDTCTVDVCLFGGRPNAYCSEDIITRAIHNDGCCPEGAYLDKDSDCPPVCGNGRCDLGETTNSCEEDCRYAGGSSGGSSSSGSSGGGYSTPT